MRTLAIKNNFSVLRNVTLSLLSVVIFSCDSLLDVDAEGTISGDVLTSEAIIQQSLLGAYYSLGGINDGSDGGELLGGDFKVIPELLVRQQSLEVVWDDVNSPTYANFLDKDILLTNLEVESNWRRAYEVINTVNDILENIAGVEDATQRKRIEGEARAIRGLLYFEMARLWAPQYSDATFNSLAIPLITQPFKSISEIKRPEISTVGEVYALVEEDLLAASEALQEFGQNGVYLNYYACQAYLMRMSMHKLDFANAQIYAENIINSGVFALATTPLAAFNNTSNSSEDVFAIQQTLANNTGDITSGSGLTYLYSSISGKGPGSFRVQGISLGASLADFYPNAPAFAGADIRGSVDSVTSETTTVLDLTKAFYRHVTSTFTLSLNKYSSADYVIPVIRMAEVYLTRGEALLELTFPDVNEVVIADLNRIRVRAGLPELVAADFGDAGQVRDTLVLERRREFYGEGLLLHDLKRWSARGWPAAINGSDPLFRKFILPYPQAETDTWSTD
jgi:hypothetical protein